MNKAAKISVKVLKILGWVLLTLLIILFLLILFVRSPWGQNIIVEKAVNFVKDKTHTEVGIDRLFITFSGNVFLEGVYLEDQNADTLLYSETLETGVAFLPLIKDGSIHVSKLKWKGLKAHVTRDAETEKFNFDFIVEAFQSDTTATAPVEEDSTSSFPDIQLGPVEMERFDLTYVDDVMGLEGRFQLGTLSLDMKRMDLNKMDFYIQDLLFSNSAIYYKQTKPFEPTEEDTTEGGPLPLVIVDRFVIDNVTAYYESQPDGITADVALGDFLLELPEANLQENKVVLKRLNLNKSEIKLKMIAQEENIADADVDTVASEGFEWPDWEVDIQNIALGDNRIVYQTGEKNPQVGHFDPNAVEVNNLSLQLNHVFLRKNDAKLNLDGFSFEEISGFELKDFGLGLKISDTDAQISDLVLATNQSELKGELLVSYASLNELMDFPERSVLHLDAQLNADVKDAYFFSPDLAKDPNFAKAAQKPVRAELELDGDLQSLNIAQADVKWGNSTSFEAKGIVRNPLETEKLYLDLPALEFRSKRSDLLAFVDENQLGIRLPEEIFFDSKLKGSLNDMVANARLKMPEGEVKLDGFYKNQDLISFDVDLLVDHLQLDKLLQNQQLGPVSFEIHSEGKGNNLEDLQAVLSSNFTELSYNENDFSGLVLEGEMNEGKGNVVLAFNGDNLDLSLEALADLDSISPQYELHLDLKGADFFKLGLTGKELRASMELNAVFEGDPESFDLVTTISDGVVVYEKRPFQLGPVDLTAYVRADSTSLDIAGDILNMQLRSNASPTELADAVQSYFSSYLAEAGAGDSVESSVEMKMNLAIKPTPILQEVILEGLTQMDSITMDVDFKESDRLLTAHLDLPYLLYNNIEVDSLSLRLDADADNLEARLGLISVEAGPLSIGRTYWSGTAKDERLHFDMVSYDEEEILLQIGSEVAFQGDTISIHIKPDELVLNKMAWTVPEDNRLLIGNKLLLFENFVWQGGQQKLSVSNEVEGVKEEHVGISFDNFCLSSITSLFNPDSLIANGTLNGSLILENLFAATGIIADVDIDSLSVTGVVLGNLSLDAKSKGDKAYDFDLGLRGGDIDLDLGGDYVAADSGARLDLKLALNELKLKAVEELSGEQIEDAEGSISGNVRLTGTIADPIYKGDFQFNEAVFTVSTINSRFTLSNEALDVDNSGLFLNNFTITDSDGHDFVVGGEVLTDDLANPSFNLTLDADNFQALHSTREDNDLFFGDLNMSSSIKITGDLNQPHVNGRLKINNDSDLTFIIPESQLDIVEREGVIVFVDKENPDEILTNRGEEKTTSELTGIQLSAIVEIEPEAIFNVIVDESSGDNLQLGGEANLSVNMDPNGRITLSGKYEVSEGHYEMSLYNLVSRKFEIDEGSSVTWGGDPMDAQLDLRAIYRVETSASELMAAQTSGSDSELANQSRQSLPFLVYLNVDGDLLKPLISFGLDMPEDQRGAVGGNVYSRVQQINSQEDELNKQVFSLLVLNRFFPATGSDGSGGGTAAMARSSVSQALSGQLNALSNSLFGGSGLELDFDLDSFQDYQEGAGQTRTQLNVSAKQRLFNDRLVVQVGSQVDVEGGSESSERGNPVFGNVSVEYLLTENGRYRLRGFRKNEFESVIDGQLIVTGLSVIFNREFNRFRELWRGTDPDKQEIKPDLERAPRPEKKKKGNQKEEKEESKKEEKEKEKAGEERSDSARTEENNIVIIRNE